MEGTTPDPDLIAAIQRAIADRDPEKEGGETRFRCPNPSGHANGDARPSARFNLTKLVWRCPVCTAGGGYIDLAKRLGIALGSNGKGKIAAVYDYSDEGGTLLFQVCRFEPKKFVQRRPDGKGGWVYKLDGVRRVLYRLPELLAAPVDAFVFVVEGERDADSLQALGLVATCNPGGAGKWRSDYNEHLRGRHVVVLPDDDRVGDEHADDVVRHLVPVVASVRRLQLPDAHDVTDWLAAGHARDELLALVDATPVEAGAQGSASSESGGRLTFTRIQDLLAEADESHEWVVDGLLPAGGVTVIVGKPKAGKSTLVRNLCHTVAEGHDFLGRATRQGAVLYLALEEKREQVKKHFRDLGGTPDAPLGIFVGRSPAEGMAQLRAVLEQARDRGEPVVLVVIDPMFRFLRVRDGNDYAAMTAALDPVIALAHETGACVVITHHAPKGERADIDAPIGSTAIAGSVDTLLVLKRTDRYRVLSSVQRTGADLPETVIELDPATRSIKVAGTREEADINAMKAAILEYLSTPSDEGRREPVDEKTIDAAVEGRTWIKRQALRALVADGSVHRIGAGKRGDPYRYGVPCVSCSLVPCICREQETKKPKPSENPQEPSLFSRSSNSADSTGTREQEIKDGEGLAEGGVS